MLPHATMHIKTIMTLFAAMLLLLLLSDCRVEGRDFSFLPLRARHVYRLLRASGHEDALPEGRVITQGLAAVAGFTLGLTKALGGIFIYDIITANVTDLEGVEGDGAASTAAIAPVVIEEMCFNTRSARSLEEAEAMAEYYTDPEEFSGDSRAINSRGRGKQRHRNKQESDLSAQATGTAADVDTEAGTGTFSTTSTSSDDVAINCVAIEKRRRRRRSQSVWV